MAGGRDGPTACGSILKNPEAARGSPACASCLLKDSDLKGPYWSSVKDPRSADGETKAQEEVLAWPRLPAKAPRFRPLRSKPSELPSSVLLPFSSWVPCRCVCGGGQGETARGADL